MAHGTVRILVAEALGTAFLLATVVGSGIMAESLADGNTALALLANSMATGAILVVLITIFGPISGAHFNPAVTLCFLIRREISAYHAMLYWLVQVTSGLAGVMVAHVMFSEPIFSASATARAGIHQWTGEFVATFGLIAAILGTIRFQPKATPWAVGLVIMAGYWYTSSTSFANPAVTIARGFTDTFSGIVPLHVPAFVLAQLVAAVAATLIFAWLLAGSDE